MQVIDAVLALIQDSGHPESITLGPMNEPADSGDIPIMFQGSFKGEEYWSAHFSRSANFVFDVHKYYFEHRNTTSQNLPSYICSDAQGRSGGREVPGLRGRVVDSGFV